MSDAKLTADIVIKFNKESLQFFNQLVKTSEKSLRKFDAVAGTVFDNLGKVNRKAMKSAVDAGKAQVKLEKAVGQSAEIVANSEKRIARATLETSKAVIQNARVLEKAKTERKENTKAVKENAKVETKASKAKADATRKEAAEDRKLAARLKRVSREKAKLNRVTDKSVSKGKKETNQLGKTAKAINKYAAKLAQVRVAVGLLKFAASAAFKLLAVPAGIVTGWTTFLGLAARGEREVSKLARSVQVGTGFLKAFSMATKDAGLSADNAVDMLEEMSNKIGDGLETPTHGTAMAFRELGLNLKEVQKMSRQKGLTTIMDSLTAFRKRSGSDQQTVRLADEIFGGEGNKFVGYLLESGELFSDLIKKNEEFNMVSDKTSTRMDSFGKSLERTKTMASGLVSEGLSEEFGVISLLLQDLQKYFSDNKEGITQRIAEIGKALTDLSMKILKVFSDPVNIELFNSAINGTVIVLNGAVKALEKALGAWSRFSDITSDVMVGDVGSAIKKGTDTEGEGFMSTVGEMLRFASPITAPRKYMETFFGQAPLGSNDNSKKDITVNNNYQLSGDNQQQIAEESARDYIEITETQ